MCKLAHWIVLTIAIGIVVCILSYVLSTFGMTITSSSATYNAGGIVCLVFICVSSVCEIVGTLLIWTRKNVLDITVNDHQILLLAKNQLK